jgi:hypothetical protein
VGEDVGYAREDLRGQKLEGTVGGRDWDADAYMFCAMVETEIYRSAIAKDHDRMIEVYEFANRQYAGEVAFESSIVSFDIE